MAANRDPIRRIALASGETRYEFTVDVGRRPKLGPDGKPVLDALGAPVTVRDQRRMRFGTYRQARAERARILAERDRGGYVPPSKTTVAEWVTSWLAGRRNLRPGTLRAYRDNLKPVVERLGHIRLDQLRKTDVDGLVVWMLADGRRVGNRTRTGLSAATVQRMLTVLSGCLRAAVAAGLLARNVADAEHVERPEHAKPEMLTWTAQAAAAFLEHTAGHRCHALWCLSLYGLRRGEVLGLRWSDLDLVAGTLTIANTRTSVAGVVSCGPPKTTRSGRTLPLDPAEVAALSGLWTAQLDERERAGPAYAQRCPSCGGQHVAVDPLGAGLRPEWYSDEFTRAARVAGLPVIRLHDTRHTAGTVMHLRGVPVAVISAWLGHASASFTMGTYVHSQADALAEAGAVLAGAYRPAAR